MEVDPENVIFEVVIWENPNQESVIFGTVAWKNPNQENPIFEILVWAKAESLLYTLEYKVYLSLPLLRTLVAYVLLCSSNFYKVWLVEIGPS